MLGEVRRHVPAVVPLAGRAVGVVALAVGVADREVEAVGWRHLVSKVIVEDVRRARGDARRFERRRLGPVTGPVDRAAAGAAEKCGQQGEQTRPVLTRRGCQAHSCCSDGVAPGSGSWPQARSGMRLRSADEAVGLRAAKKGNTAARVKTCGCIMATPARPDSAAPTMPSMKTSADRSTAARVTQWPPPHNKSDEQGRGHV
jgi:hypothetical protein